MRDASDIRHWITWSGSALRRSSDESDADAIGAALGVSPRTVRAWRARNAAPPWALRAMMQAVSGLPAYAENWSGWRFKPGPGGAILGGPDGSEWVPADLARYRDALERADALERRLSPGSQLVWMAPGAGRRQAWPGGVAPSWQQLEDALRGVLESASRHLIAAA